MINKKIGVTALFFIVILLVSNIESAYVFGQSFDFQSRSLDTSLNRPRFGDISSQLPGQFGALGDDEYSPLIISVDNYEPTVLTDNLLGEGRIVPVFVNLKAYSIDPTLEPVIKNYRINVKDVKSKPEHANARSLFLAGTKYFPPETPGLDDFGFIVVYLKPLPREHLPIEQTTLFRDLPSFKQNEIIGNLKDRLVNITENEKIKILEEQTRSLILQQKNDEWVNLLPRKNAFLEELTIEMEADIRYDINAGFGISEEELVLDYENNKRSFWKGQGSIGLKEIKDNTAVFNIYSGKDRLIQQDVPLREGGNSNVFTLSRGLGFSDYFRGNFKVQLQDIRDKGNRVILNVNGNNVVLGKGDQLQGTNWVVEEIIVDDSFDRTTKELRRRERVKLLNKKTLERKELITESLKAKGEIIEKKIEGTGTVITRGKLSDDIYINVENFNSEIINAINDLRNFEAIDSDLTPSLVKAIIAQESGGNFKAVSDCGATGLMQLMPGTAIDRGSRFGLNNIFEGARFTDCNNPYGARLKASISGKSDLEVIGLDDRFVAGKNIRAGVFYLNFLLSSFSRYSNKVSFAIASYNTGEGNVQNAINEIGGDSSFESVSNRLRPETQAFVPSVGGYKIDFDNRGGVPTVATSTRTTTTYETTLTFPGPTESDFVDVINEYEKIAKEFEDEEDAYTTSSVSTAGSTTVEKPKGDKIAAKALFRIAKIYEDLGINSNAVLYYGRVLNEYPGFAAKYGITNEFIELLKLTGDWDVRRASFSDERVSVTLVRVEEVKPDENAFVRLGIKVKGEENFITGQYNYNQEIPKTGCKIGNIYGDKVELVKKDSPYIRCAEVLKDREASITGEGGVAYIIKLVETNVKNTKEAKVKIIPNLNLARSRTEFTIHLPVEKRTIQLSPQQIENQIKKAEALSKKLEAVASKLDKVIFVLQNACFFFGTYLSLKNGFAGKNKLVARQQVMGEYVNGVCKKEELNVENCAKKYSDQIEDRVNNVEKKLDEYGNYRKEIAKLNYDEANKEASKKTILEKRKILLSEQFGVKDDIFFNENILNDLSEEEFNDLTIKLSVYETDRYDLLKQNYDQRLEKIKEREERIKVIRDIIDSGNKTLSDERILEIAEADFLSERIGGSVNRIYYGSDNKPRILYKGKEQIVELSADGKSAKFKDDKDNEITVIIRNVVDKNNFGTYIGNKRITIDDCKVQVIPYKNGEYLRVEYTGAFLSRIFVFNAGADGGMYDGTGFANDDRLSRVLTDPSNREFQEISVLVGQRNQDLTRNNCNVARLRLPVIGGELVEVVQESQVGKFDQCEYFNTAGECRTLYTICDPVVCPSSRFDLGGRVKVENPIQTGIVGGIILGAPRGTVCLTGINAGIKNLATMSKAYGQCLKTARDEDRSTGLCDKIQSVYICEFIWKNVVPLATSGAIFNFKGLFSGNPFGNNNGGEYLDFSTNFENAKQSWNFFFNNYAKNAFSLFRSPDVNDVGTVLCRRAIFSSVPGGNIFNRIGKPEDPVQYTAWFDEKVYSKQRVRTSAYSIYYHIYAGENNVDLLNRNFLEYSVYLRDPELGLQYVTNPPKKRLNAGDFADENTDLILPSGFSEICVEINGRANCNFGKVSTGFALNYLADYYTSGQAGKQINSAEQCTSTYSEGYREGQSSYYAYNLGRTSSLGYTSTGALNVQNRRVSGSDYNYAGQKFGIFANGIQRVCGVLNPSEGTGRENQWQVIGTCGTDKVTKASLGNCWVNIESVKNSINTDFLENRTLEQIKTIAEKGNLKDFKKYTEPTAEEIKQNIIDDFAKIKDTKKSIESYEINLANGKNAFISGLKSSALKINLLNEDDFNRINEMIDNTDKAFASLDIKTSAGGAEVRYVRNELKEMKVWINEETELLKNVVCNLDIATDGKCTVNVNKGTGEFYVVFSKDYYLFKIRDGKINLVSAAAVISKTATFKDKFDLNGDTNPDIEVDVKDEEGRLVYVVTGTKLGVRTAGGGGATTTDTITTGPATTNTGTEASGSRDGKCILVGDVWKCTGFVKGEEVVIRNLKFVLDTGKTGTAGISISALKLGVYYGFNKIQCGVGTDEITITRNDNFKVCNDFRAIELKVDKEIDENGKNDFSIKFDIKDENFEFLHQALPVIYFKFENGKWKWKKQGGQFSDKYNDIIDINYDVLLGPNNGYISQLKDKNFIEGINFLLELIYKDDPFKFNSIVVKYKDKQLTSFAHKTDRYENLVKLSYAFYDLYNFGVTLTPAVTRGFDEEIKGIISRNNINTIRTEFEYEEDAFNDKPNVFFRYFEETKEWKWRVIATQGRLGYKKLDEYNEQEVQDSSLKKIFNSLKGKDFVDGATFLLDNVRKGQGDYGDDEIIIHYKNGNRKVKHGELNKQEEIYALEGFFINQNRASS